MTAICTKCAEPWLDESHRCQDQLVARLIEENARLVDPLMTYEGWGLLVKPPITHGQSCAFVTLPDGKEFRAEDADCTCGYEWRVRLSTYMTLYNAWRKRAERAEAEVAQLRERIAALEAERDQWRDQDSRELKEWQAIAERMEAERDALKADAERYRSLLFKLGAMHESPCFNCGYNGPGYYQPSKHPCAVKHHAAIDAVREP